ncbi:MAG: methyltransferase domain [Trebouxia sp. A1-2]|nr:MAG: methyltransferase domain [Trebouxia sp. A1-2]
MLQKLQSTAKELKITNLTSQIADAQDLSFASDCSYDAITFSLGVHFLPNKAKCLAECFRVLKPGGVLIASAVGPFDKTDGVRITKAVHDRLTPSAPWLDVNALGQEGAFIDLVTHAGFENPHLCTVSIPITGSMDQMKQMSIRGLLSTALAAEQQRRLTPSAPWLDVNALGQEGAFIDLVTHAGFENPHLCTVSIPITGSMDQMKQMSIRGLLSTALAAEQQRRQKEGTDNSSGSIFQEAESLIEEV